MGWDKINQFREGHDKITLRMKICDIEWSSLSSAKFKINLPSGEKKEVDAMIDGVEGVIFYEIDTNEISVSTKGVYSAVGILIFNDGKIGKTKHLLYFKIVDEFHEEM